MSAITAKASRKMKKYAVLTREPRCFLGSFDFSWEQRKLGELVDVCSGRDYKHLLEGTIPVYGTGGYMLSVNDALSYDRDAIGIGRKGTIDRPYILKAPFWTVDTLFYAIPREKVDLNYAFDIFQNIDWKKKDESTGVPSLSKTAINDIDVLAPKHDEQQIIGQFFAAIDNLITLHQRKCALLFSPFQALISMMFTTSTFSWEQRKLGEIGSVSMCRRIFKEQTSETGDIPFYKIGTFGAEPDAFISRELFEEYKSKYPYPKKGDILISASGSIGRTVEFAGNNEYFQDSNIVWLSHDERLSNSFLKCFYSVVKWAGIEGSTIKRLYNDNILNTVICMPSVPEQEHIGLFFENLDNLITLHQRKFEKLTNVKKSMLEKMFPQNGSSYPEIRFKGFTDPWEQRKLSELTSMHARIGWQNLRTSEFLDSGNYMLITGTDFNDGAINFSTCHYVERERYEQDRNIQIHNGSILITKDGTLGKVAYVQGLSMPATLNAGVFNVQIKDANNVDEKYLFQYLKAPFLMDYVDKKATGGTIKHLNQSILVDFPVILPQRSEQTLIGAFFLQLDNLITLHQRELEKLQNIKKSMLEKMFV